MEKEEKRGKYTIRAVLVMLGGLVVFVFLLACFAAATWDHPRRSSVNTATVNGAYDMRGSQEGAVAIWAWRGESLQKLVMSFRLGASEAGGEICDVNLEKRTITLRFKPKRVVSEGARDIVQIKDGTCAWGSDVDRIEIKTEWRFLMTR